MFENSIKQVRSYATEHKLDMFWIERYIKFIDNCYKTYKDKKLENCHWHHVMPRTWNGSDKNENIITLPIKAHVIVHQILDRVGDESMHVAFRNGFMNVCAISEFNYIPTLRQVESILKDRHSTGIPIVNLTTHEEFPSSQAAEKVYGLPKGYLARFKNGDKIAGCYWQTKELVDKNGIEYELERIKKHKDEIRSTPVNRVRNSSYRDRPIICIDDESEYSDYRELAKVKSVSQEYNVVTSIKRLHRIKGNAFQFKDVIEKDGLQYWKDQYKQKDEQSLKERSNWKKKVANLTTKQIYQDVYIASEQLGIKPNKLKNIIYSKIKYNDCYWGYYNDEDDIVQLEKQILDFVDQNKKDWSKARLRPVYKLSTKEWYPSTVAAVEALGLKDRSGIAGAISKANKIKGSYWQYAEIVDQIGFEQAINDQEARHEMLKHRKKMKTE